MRHGLALVRAVSWVALLSYAGLLSFAELCWAAARVALLSYYTHQHLVQGSIAPMCAVVEPGSGQSRLGASLIVPKVIFKVFQ